MKKTLTLAADLHVPLDLATHVTLIAGKRGSGKTNTAKRLVEQAIRAGVPVAILDPADVWWGLRAGQDGAATGGLPIHVFGGRHADLPLESTAGTLLADVVIDQRVSVVLSIREFSGGERARFITDFAQRLIRRNVNPLLVVAEEAHEVMPQGKTMGQESVSLGAMLRLVTLGRSSGIGLVQVTQRLARLNKTATTQSDVLFAHRTIGPQDRNALEEWIKYHHAGSFRAPFMEQLAALKTGDAWLWAPDFPEDQPIGLRQVSIARCDTFNSHATPKVGEVRQEPKALAPVDLERLRTRMAATLERAKADDPKELKRQIAELKAQNSKLSNSSNRPEYLTKAVPALTDADRTLIEKLAQQLGDARDALITQWGQVITDGCEKVTQASTEAWAKIITSRAELEGTFERRLEQKGVKALLEKLHALAAGAPPIGRSTDRTPANRPSTAPPSAPPRQQPPRSPQVRGDDLTGPEQRILDAIAWLEDLGIDTPEQPAVAFLAGYTYGGGAFNNPRGALRGKGLLEYVGDRLRLTETGRAAAHHADIPLDALTLQARILARLPGPEQRLLRPLLDAYPKALTNDELARAAHYAPGAGAFNNPRGRLRSLGLVEYPQPGYVAARPLLFPDGGQ